MLHIFFVMLFEHGKKKITKCMNRFGFVFNTKLSVMSLQ